MEMIENIIKFPVLKYDKMHHQHSSLGLPKTKMLLEAPFY